MSPADFNTHTEERYTANHECHPAESKKPQISSQFSKTFNLRGKASSKPAEPQHKKSASALTASKRECGDVLAQALRPAPLKTPKSAKPNFTLDQMIKFLRRENEQLQCERKYHIQLQGPSTRLIGVVNRCTEELNKGVLEFKDTQNRLNDEHLRGKASSKPGEPQHKKSASALTASKRECGDVLAQALRPAPLKTPKSAKPNFTLDQMIKFLRRENEQLQCEREYHIKLQGASTRLLGVVNRCTEELNKGILEFKDTQNRLNEEYLRGKASSKPGEPQHKKSASALTASKRECGDILAQALRPAPLKTPKSAKPNFTLDQMIKFVRRENDELQYEREYHIQLQGARTRLLGVVNRSTEELKKGVLEFKDTQNRLNEEYYSVTRRRER